MIKNKGKSNKVLGFLGVALIGILAGLFLVILEFFQDVGIFLGFKTIIQEGFVITFIQNAMWPCIIVCILSVIAYAIGRKTDSSLELFRKKPDKKDFKFWILIVVSALVLPVAYFFFQTLVVNSYFYVFNANALLKAIFYDSIVGELFFNFCVTSLIVFLVSKVFFRKEKKINKLGVILSVVFSVLFVFSIQLNSIFSMYESITAIFLLWAVLQYFVMDAVYAYIYVRYGLKWSVFVHIVFTIMFLGVCPLLFV